MRLRKPEISKVNINSRKKLLQRNLAEVFDLPVKCKETKMIDNFINVGDISTDEDMKDIEFSDIDS
jgi:hypothetical protein